MDENTKFLHRYYLQDKMMRLEQEITSLYYLLTDYKFDSENDLFPDEWRDKETFIYLLTRQIQKL